MQWKLREKLILWLLPVILPVLVMVYFSHQKMAHMASRHAERIHTLLLRHGAKTIDLFLEDQLYRFSAICREDVFGLGLEYGLTSEMESQLRDLLEKHREWAALILLQNDGKVFRGFFRRGGELLPIPLLDEVLVLPSVPSPESFFVSYHDASCYRKWGLSFDRSCLFAFRTRDSKKKSNGTLLTVLDGGVIQDHLRHLRTEAFAKNGFSQAQVGWVMIESPQEKRLSTVAHSASIAFEEKEMAEILIPAIQKESEGQNSLLTFQGERYALTWTRLHDARSLGLVWRSLTSPGDRSSFENEIPSSHHRSSHILFTLVPYREIVAEARALLLVNTLIAAGAMALLFVLIVLITARITNPIRRCVALADALRQGDLSQRLEIAGTDEIARLCQTLDEMAGEFSTFLVQVNEMGIQMATGSKQLSNASQSLSQGAASTAASLEEITSMLSQFTHRAAANAKNAVEANRLVQTSRIAADQGREKMESLVKALAEIEEATQAIRKIMKMVDDIAFQTNLLAVNAAIEAARAGVHGKGFAVVAEEVRNLAARSAEAAHETAEMIEKAYQKALAGGEAGNQTAESLQEILNAVSRVATLVGEIATSSGEQAEGVRQIHEGLRQIENVTHTNSATAEETASTAEELAARANELSKTLSRFRYRPEPASASSFTPPASSEEKKDFFSASQVIEASPSVGIPRLPFPSDVTHDGTS